MSHNDTAASKMDTDAFDTDTFKWQVDRMFGIWKSAKHEISNWIQEAGTYRSTVFLDRVHTAFFHSKDFTWLGP